MKKIILGLSILFTSIVANSFALPCVMTSLDTRVPSFCGGVIFGLTGLYWCPSINELDFALIYPFVDFGTTPLLRDGEFKLINSRREWDYRVSLGYAFPCTANDLIVAYTKYEHKERDVIKNPFLESLNVFSTLAAVDGFPSNNLGIVNFPFTFIFETIPISFLVSANVPILVAKAKVDIDYQAWDVELGQSMDVGCRFRFRWFGGLRFAELKQRFNATYGGSVLVQEDPIIPSAFVADFFIDSVFKVNQKSDFRGFGPRLGLGANYCIAGGFGLVAQASSSLLVGESDSTFHDELTQTIFGGLFTDTFLPREITFPTALAVNTETISTIVDFKHPDRIRVIPNLEAKVAVDYSHRFCRGTVITIEAGYMATYYWSPVDRLSSVDAAQPQFRTRHTINTGFDGPFIGIQFLI